MPSSIAALFARMKRLVSEQVDFARFGGGEQAIGHEAARLDMLVMEFGLRRFLTSNFGHIAVNAIDKRAVFGHYSEQTAVRRNVRPRDRRFDFQPGDEFEDERLFLLR